MKYIVVFLVIFILFFAGYYIYYVMFARRGKKCPTEGTYLIRLYKLDINKFSYKKFLLHISLLTSIDLAITATVIYGFEKLIWQILFGLITVIPVVAISFIIVGKYYQYKQTKDNSRELNRENRWIERQDKILKIFKKKGKK